MNSAARFNNHSERQKIMRIFHVTLTALALFVLSGCAAVQTTGGRFDTTPRLAVISAFDVELEKLRSATTVTATYEVNGRTHYLGRLAGQDVVLLQSGFSMVNAAMTTQALLDRFNITGIVFSGIAGGVNPGLHVGDVSVPAQWGNYQENIFARETESGYDPGRFKAEFKNFGMMFPHSSSVPALDGGPDKLERRFWFPVDRKALDRASRLSGKVSLGKCTASGECLNNTPHLVVGGNGVSGPTFVDNATYRQWAWETFQADALDMETAAVAHVSYVNRVPYIAFRSLSDLAGGGVGKNEGKIFGKLAADNSATVVIEYLKSIGE
ncbi:MAG: 5'-methylthioadenosine/S-adenosylhomocysteine nucleosidase [Oryzomonas sp.]|jgi:adenosylhomocysteine nucleosidase